MIDDLLDSIPPVESDPVASYRDRLEQARDAWSHGDHVAALFALGRAYELAEQWSERARQQGDTPALERWGRRTRWAETLGVWCRSQGEIGEMWRHEASGEILRRRWHRSAIVVELLEATADGVQWHRIEPGETCPCGGSIESTRTHTDIVEQTCQQCGLRLYRREP